MDNAASLQILQRVKQLKDYLTDSFLWYLELPLFQIVKQVLPLRPLQHYIEQVRCLKQIHQSYYVPMLAPLEYVELPLLLRHLNDLHARLLDGLDRHQLARLDVAARAHFSELALAQRVRLVQGVEIEQGPVTRLVTQKVAPVFLL